jgi:predicted transglutaminase-like protease
MAQEYIKDNLFLVCEAMEEFGCIDKLAEKLSNEEYEYLDVTIRCYLLYQAVAAVLDEMEV